MSNIKIRTKLSITLLLASTKSNAFLHPQNKPLLSHLHEQKVNIKELLGPVSRTTMQSYNLSPSLLSDGWSAQIVTRTAKSMEETTAVELVAKNAEHFVDTISVDIPLIKKDGIIQVGLGIELLEVEGGRQDGLGVVIVNGLVQGGNAERACNNNADDETIMYGDSISSADLLIQRKSDTEVTSVTTECLDYESTVDALSTLLSPLHDETKNIDSASIIVTLKRLRRRPKINVRLEYPPDQNLPSETITLQPGDNLRMSMLQRGIKLNDPLAKRYDGKPTGSGNCGSSGLCRTCAVSVVRGGELLSPPKVNEKKMLEDTPRWRLAVSRVLQLCFVFAVVRKLMELFCSVRVGWGMDGKREML
jgi:ferredoxin